MTHHTNHASFELPAQLKDKTMHMFTLNDAGPSEFSIVMSHAAAQPDDTLASFSDRLVAELGKALPDFSLDSSAARMLDGTPAIGLAYRWRNESNLMHQRQVITLLPASKDGESEALLIAATCFQAFSDEWSGAFEAMLDSVKLRHNPAAGGNAAPAPAALASTVFALSERRRTLHAFASAEEACRKIDAREVEQDAWAFFDAAGMALQATFVVPNSGTLWRKAGSYSLEARLGRAPGLHERLHQASVFVAGSPTVRLSSIAEVQAMLGHAAGG